MLKVSWTVEWWDWRRKVRMYCLQLVVHMADAV